LQYAHTAVDAAQDAHLVIVATGWPEFGAVDPHTVAQRVATPILLDARGVIAGPRWTAAGWTVVGLGCQP
jgi:UDPglucose 6-dehydrogenase